MFSLATKLIIRTVSTVKLESHAVEDLSSPVCVYVIVNNRNCQAQSQNLKSQVLNLKLYLVTKYSAGAELQSKIERKIKRIGGEF